MSAKRRKTGQITARVFVIIHAVVVLLPILAIAVWAFTARWAWPSLMPDELSVRGIQEIFAGRGTTTGPVMIAVSVGIALAVSVLCTVVAALAARAIHLHEWRGKAVFHFVTMMPFLIPSTVFAMGVQVFFLRVGLAGTVPGIVFAHSIVALPYAITIMCDVTRATGTRLEEASASLGADWWNTMRHITVPALLPGVLSSMSMCYIISFSQYFLTLLIGNGKVRTLAVIMFPFLNGGDRTIAGAYALTFIVLTFAVFVVFELLLKRFQLQENQEMFGA